MANRSPRFRKHGARENHERQHKGLKEFHCHLCPKEFMQKRQLAVHIKRHLGQKDHVCQVLACRLEAVALMHCSAQICGSLMHCSALISGSLMHCSTLICGSLMHCSSLICGSLMH